MFLAIAVLLLQIPQAESASAAIASKEPPAVAPQAAGSAAAQSSGPALDLRQPRPDFRSRKGLARLLGMAEENSIPQPPIHPGQLERQDARPAGDLEGPLPAGARGRHAEPPSGVVSVFELQAETGKKKRIWYGLAAVQHSAAVFDAWSTRRAIENGGHEQNPLLRPFAHSNALYAVTQVTPTLLDYLGKRMMTSRRSWIRRVWWLPQIASTAASLGSGIHNLGVSRQTTP